MELHKLNKLVRKIEFIHEHLARHDKDPLLEESLLEYIKHLKDTYSSYLYEKLFDIYDDYFTDDEMEALETYIFGEGVVVEGSEVGEHKVNVVLKAYPLRVEIRNDDLTLREILWRAA